MNCSEAGLIIARSLCLWSVLTAIKNVLSPSSEKKINRKAEAKPVLMSPRSPSTSAGCRPPNCVAAIACCVPWSMSTPATVANASPHDASNGGTLNPPRHAGSAAFRTDSPVPPPNGGGGGLPESHLGRHLNTERPGSGSLARRGGVRRDGRGALVRMGVEAAAANTVEQEQEAGEAATEAMARRRGGGCGLAGAGVTFRLLSAVASG